MSDLKDIISDEEIDMVHGNENFGSGQSNRDIVNEMVLQVSNGYHIGSTARRILIDHGLAKQRKNPYANLYLKVKGLRYLKIIKENKESK